MAASLDKVHEAWSAIKNDINYRAMPSEEKAKVKDIFKERMPDSAGYFNQIEGPDRGFLENVGTLAKDSWFAATGAMQLSDDVAAGSFGSNSAAVIEKGHRRTEAQYKPPELQRMEEMLQGITQRYDEAQGFDEKFKSVAGSVGEAVKEVFTNPKGVAYLSASSAGHSAPPIAGAIAGAAATGPLPSPHAKLLGGLIGSFTGGSSVEAGSRFQEEVVNELQQSNLPVTEDNINILLQNKEFTDKALSASRGKAFGTAGVDAVLGVSVGKIGTQPIRSARKQAMKELGSDIPEELLNKRVLEIVGQRTLGQRVGTGLKAYSAGIASEPISELAGQLAAGDKVDVGELFGEAIGAIGMSAISTPADIYAFGTETPQIQSQIQKLRDAVKQKVAPKSEELKQAEALNKTQASHNYKAKIEEAAKAQDVTKYADLTSPEYNPIIAIDSLKAMNMDKATTAEAKIDNLNQALEILSDVEDKQIIVIRRGLELTQKRDAKTITKEEQTELNELIKVNKENSILYENLKNTVTSMQKTNITPEDLQKELQAAVSSNDPKQIDSAVKRLLADPTNIGKQSFGSSLQSIQANPATSAETKAFIRDIGVYQNTRKKLEEAQGKEVSDVHTNIVSGVSGKWKGINTYHKNISDLVAADNIPLAQKELQEMTAFAQNHRMKADTLKRLQEEALGGTKLTAEEQKNLDTLNSKKLTPYKVTNPQSAKWLNLLDTVELEAQAIEQAVQVATGLLPKQAATKPGINTKQTATTSQQVATNNPPSNKASVTEQTVASNILPVDETQTTEQLTSETQDTAPVIPTATPGVQQNKPAPTVEGVADTNTDKNTSQDESSTFTDKDLDGISIRVRRKSTDGRVIIIKLPAKEALSDTDKDIEMYKKLLDCVA